MLSSLAGQIRNVATLYQVYNISGSAFKLGLTGFLETLPFIIFGLYAGAVADAFDRKKMLVATISLQIVPNLVIGILTLTVGLAGRRLMFVFEHTALVSLGEHRFDSLY